MTRRRGRALAEWTVAVALLAGGVWAADRVIDQVRRLERVVPVTPLSAREAADSTAPVAPASIPPRSVSVPLLAIGDNLLIKVGDRAADVLARLEGLAVAGVAGVERLATGERITREFAHAAGRFHLVLEAEPAGVARVTAIYVP
jgi:hypothetical protein